MKRIIYLLVIAFTTTVNAQHSRLSIKKADK